MSLNPRILLIEDDPNDAVSLCLALEESIPNVQLSVVNDQTGLMAYLRHIDEEGQQAPWLIFLDVSFPTQVDGLEALLQLQRYFSTSSSPSIPVIAVSASAQLTDMQKFYESGTNSYLIKSGSFQQLVSDCKAIARYWLKTVMLPPSPPERQ